jgi:hypothetical protein
MLVPAPLLATTAIAAVHYSCGGARAGAPVLAPRGQLLNSPQQSVSAQLVRVGGVASDEQVREL